MKARIVLDLCGFFLLSLLQAAIHRLGQTRVGEKKAPHGVYMRGCGKNVLTLRLTKRWSRFI
jgi:hypothetical protein